MFQNKAGSQLNDSVKMPETGIAVLNHHFNPDKPAEGYQWLIYPFNILLSVFFTLAYS